ncbi:MAG: hypothetical protein EXR72_12020 [Myxococcales bacterium]|nr:hypothetical protein [Myxococcales bacterium]
MLEKRSCDGCGRPTDEPRRGLCSACYIREPSDAIPIHGACASCGERRRMILRWARLAVGRVLTCYNCGHVADNARPKVQDVPALRDLMTRDRRTDDRRKGLIRLDGEDGRRGTVRRAPDRLLRRD